MELKNLSGRLSIICVKGGKPVGHTVIPLDTYVCLKNNEGIVELTVMVS